MSQQGHGTVGEPVEECGAFLIAERQGIRPHPGLEARPVGDGRTHVRQYVPDCVHQLAPATRIGAVDLQVHDRFALPAAGKGSQIAIAVALDVQHRVEQAMDGEAACRHGCRDRIDQEGHVVIDHAHAHAPLPDRATHGFEPDHGLARRALLRAFQQEPGGLGTLFVGEAGQFPGQRAIHQRLPDRGRKPPVSGRVRFQA